MFIKNAKVTVDAIAASDVVQSFTCNPTVNNVSFEPISGNAASSATLGPWTGVMIYAQDWEDPTSLAHLLHDRFGEEVELTFKPIGDAGGTWTVTVTVVPGSIGGAAGAAVSTVNLPCKAKPVWTAKTAA